MEQTSIMRIKFIDNFSKTTIIVTATSYSQPRITRIGLCSENRTLADQSYGFRNFISFHE